MGGNISVVSEEGKGSIFTFNVAVKEGKPEVVSAMSDKHVISIDNPRKTYRILVVDDKKENMKLTVIFLQRAGFETNEAFNGKEAIAKFEQWSPHLILMDMRMPVMDGFEATNIINAT